MAINGPGERTVLLIEVSEAEREGSVRASVNSAHLLCYLIFEFVFILSFLSSSEFLIVHLILL